MSSPSPDTMTARRVSSPHCTDECSVSADLNNDEAGLSEITTVYIGNLPPTVDEYTLAWTLGFLGPVLHAQIIRDKGSRASRGYGFVTFSHPAYATVAMQQLNGKPMYGPFAGNRIKVAPSNKKKNEMYRQM